MVHHKLFEDHDKFRKDLAYFMYIFGDHKNFLPTHAESLRELFTLYRNDVEYVYSKKESKMYKYTYELMCVDLSTEFSWTRLPTQIIMMVISYILNVKFLTISNATKHNTNNYVSEICNATDDPMEIYLGHIDEIHYVPLEKVPDGNNIDELQVLKYSDAKYKFYKWAITMYNSLNIEPVIHQEKNEPEFTDVTNNANKDKLVHFK